MERVCFESHVADASSTDSAVRYFPREEIVRCRDCKKWSYEDTKNGTRRGECGEFTDEWRRAITRESGFCAWGRRRSDR